MRTFPFGNPGQVDYEPHQVSPRRTYSRPIRHATFRVPNIGATSTQWNQIDVRTPSVMRLRSRTPTTPAFGVETLEFYYAPDPPPPTLVDGMLASGGAAYFSTPGLWFWQVVCPEVATCDLDYNLMDLDSDQAAYAELDKVQASRLFQSSKSVPSSSDLLLLPANQNVERKRVRITLTTGGGPTIWVNLGAVASATANIGFIGANGQTLDLDCRMLPLYSIHAFNTSAISAANLSLAVFY